MPLNGKCLQALILVYSNPDEVFWHFVKVWMNWHEGKTICLKIMFWKKKWIIKVVSLRYLKFYDFTYKFLRFCSPWNASEEMSLMSFWFKSLQVKVNEITIRVISISWIDLASCNLHSYIIKKMQFHTRKVLELCTYVSSWDAQVIHVTKKACKYGQYY